MNAFRFWRLLLALAALGMVWAGATPAQAQLAPGCSCPAGFTPLSGSTCSFTPALAVVIVKAAICPLRNVNVGQIASAQQQQSFWGVNQMLQQKRDQLQATPVIHSASAGNFRLCVLRSERGLACAFLFEFRAIAEVRSVCRPHQPGGTGRDQCEFWRLGAGTRRLAARQRAVVSRSRPLQQHLCGAGRVRPHDARGAIGR